MGKEVLLIHSFKGGSGKTIFSTNLAKILAERGKRVLLIETDFVMASFQSIFTAIKPDVYLNNFFMSDELNLGYYTYTSSENENLDIIFADQNYNPRHKIFSQDQSWYSEKLIQLDKALKKLDYDYIIFDTTPGSSLIIINLLILTDTVFLLMRPDGQSISGSEVLIDRIYKKTVDLGNSIQLSPIINQIPKVNEMQDIIDKITQQFRFKYPFVKEIETVEYDHYTSYLTTVHQFILPDGNPTRKKFEYIADKLIVKFE